MQVGDSIVVGDTDYRVLAVDRFGQPLRVEAAEPHLRKSTIEAFMLLHLAIRHVGREIRAALPAPLRRWLA